MSLLDKKKLTNWFLLTRTGLLTHTLGTQSSTILPFSCEVELILIEELYVEFEHKVEHEKTSVILWLVVAFSDFCDDFDG